MNRRNFLKNTALASAGLVFTDKIIADPYRPLLIRPKRYGQILISGRVTSEGRGIKNVVVSDGLSCVQTSADGSYQLVSSTAQGHIFIPTPAGYKIPVSGKGTALHYSAIDSSKEKNSISFELQKDLPDNEHSFLLLADPQTQTMEDVELLEKQTIPDVIEMAGRISNPVFGVSCGDIMYNDLKLFPQYENAIGSTGIPFFQVLGNHDVETMASTDEQSAVTFKKYFGPSYYSFNKGEIHYVVLDDVFWFGGGYIGYINQEQIDWLINDLSFIEKGRTVVLFVHIPVYTKIHERFKEKKPDNSVVVTNRELLYKILELYNSYIICGHMHESEYLVDGGCEIHIGGAVCGAWWTGLICHDGTPNGYMVYDVKGSDLKWKYKPTGMSHNYQMKLYKDYPFDGEKGLIMANVWGYDEKWRVIYYENGIRKGEMRRIISLDPLSVELYSGDKKPAKHTWIEPGFTDHLFVVKPETGKGEIIVEATNRFGEVFSDKILL